MPVREKVPNERYRPGQRLKVYLVDVNKDPARPAADRLPRPSNLVKRLFELEVPEIFSGVVEIMAIAREPGIALEGRGRGPAGQGRSGRLMRRHSWRAHPEHRQRAEGEKIDVIEWSPETTTFIANALSAGQLLSVGLNEEEKDARVMVPSDQMSLAIGKEGQNARLAYKLTGWRIDVKDPESLKDGERRSAGRGARCVGRRRAVKTSCCWAGSHAWSGWMAPSRSASASSDRSRRIWLACSVDVEVIDGKVSVYYARELRAPLTSFDTGTSCRLYDDAVGRRAT